MPSQKSQQASQSSGSQASNNPTPSTTKQPTRYSVVRDGWGGSRTHFQHSYGLQMDQEGIEEGNAILDAYIQHDREAERK